MTRVAVEVNGTPHVEDVEPRLLLADFLRDSLQLTGTHLGCEHGICGTCTVQIDGNPARSCLTLAVQVDGTAVRTVEGLAADDGKPLHPLQEAFHQHHALQCGYCTPGFLMSIEPLLPELRGASDREVREQLSGNLCRCTGYQSIVEATRAAVSELEAASAETPTRVASVEVSLGEPIDKSSLWALLLDPSGLLRELGVVGLAASGPKGWRGRLPGEKTTFEGVLELIDVDDDRRVANFAVQGRASAAGHVRGALTLALGEADVAVRLELELIGMDEVPDHEPLEHRLRAGAEAWIEGLVAAEPEPPRLGIASAGQATARLRELGVVLTLASAVWVSWRALRKRR